MAQNKEKGLSEEEALSLSRTLLSMSVQNTAMVHYPKTFRNKVITLKTTSLDRKPIPTLFIAIQSQGYPYEYFRSDIEITHRFFKRVEFSDHVLDNEFEILLKPQTNFLTNEASDQMEKVIDFLNRGIKTEIGVNAENIEIPTRITAATSGDSPVSLHKIVFKPVTELRIVSLGVKISSEYFGALEFMLNQWTATSKHVQFIANADLKTYDSFRFWKTACINKIVDDVEFINLSEYLPFGHFTDASGRLLVSDPKSTKEESDEKK